MHRRRFLRTTIAAAGSTLVPGALGRLAVQASPTGGTTSAPPAGATARPFRISLAQWSLNKSFFGGKLDPMDFPGIARRRFGIDTVEYVDQFYKGKARDAATVGELRKRCEAEGVRSGLIMVDTAGRLADPDEAKRAEAIEAHKGWLEAAKALGCHSMRVNAWGEGTPEEMRKRMVESAGKLAEEAGKLGLNLVIENHGGPSSDPDWMAGLMREVGSPFLGTLPDFGNFPATTDAFAAVGKLVPWARGVSVKGDGSSIPRMMRIVLDAGFRQWAGIESGAAAADGEPEAITKMKAILDEVLAREPVLKPIFNGRDLDGWEKVDGGDWAVEDGVLVGRNGKDWSTDPSRTGSWLRTAREYGDFELSLEFAMGPGTNSGVFLRSALERNPAFTGYEVQIVDRAGDKPTKGGPGSLYDFVAPRRNTIRPAGEWNTLRVVARGPAIRVHLNDEWIVDARGDRRPRGYLGLQNHDARSVIRYRNVLLAEL